MITNYQRLMTTFVAIVGVSIFVVVMPVNAGDDTDNFIRTYPASRCQVWGADISAGVNTSAGYSQFGRLANKHHSKPLNVVCPIDRKENFSTKGLDFLRVYYLDRHLTQALTCTVYSVDVNGETVVVSEQLTNDAGGSEDFRQMTFYNIDKSIISDIDINVGPGSMYTVFCTIPPKVGSDGFSWVSAITVRETPEE